LFCFLFNNSINNAIYTLSLHDALPISSNTNSFVTASVPLKLRSNAAYVLSMSATVTSTGSTSNKIENTDVGFGLGSVTRSGTGVNTGGSDTNATSGDPTLAGNGSVNAGTGRYEYTAVKSNLSAFSASTTALNGAFILNAVPRSNTNGLTVPAMFAIKPQFYENGSTTVSVTFTVTAPSEMNLRSVNCSIS